MEIHKKQIEVYGREVRIHIEGYLSFKGYVKLYFEGVLDKFSKTRLNIRKFKFKDMDLDVSNLKIVKFDDGSASVIEFKYFFEDICCMDVQLLLVKPKSSSVNKFISIFTTKNVYMSKSDLILEIKQDTICKPY
jgi:hypothetical protein